MADTDDNTELVIIDDITAVITRHKETDWAELDHQLVAFGFEYLSNGFKHGDAAEKAGRARSAGIKLVRDPIVSAFISYLQEKNFASTIITKQFVESQYLEIIPILKGEEGVPMVDKEGNEFTGKKFHSSEIVSVLRDLSKVTGYVEAEKINNNAVTVQLNFGAVMTDAKVIEHG